MKITLPTYQQRRRSYLLDLPLDGLTQEETKDIAEMHLLRRHRQGLLRWMWAEQQRKLQQGPACAEDSSLNDPTISGEPERFYPCHIVTLNPEIAWAAQRDPAYAKAIEEAGLVVPDGIGVVLAARLKGLAIPERVAGYDLLQKLLVLAAAKEYRVFMLGAAPGVAERAAVLAEAAYPGLDVVGTADGYFKSDEEGDLIERISALNCDMLFCALGPPRPAEIWINAHLAELNVGIAMGVGGSFDVMTGKVTRAPLWMQRLGLEWLHRVIQEPRRIRRLMVIPKFMLAVIFGKKK